MTVPTGAAKSLPVSSRPNEISPEQRVTFGTSSNQAILANTKVKNAEVEVTSATNQKQPAIDVPSRTSFLGLPPEMRLHIYEFLLDASRRPASEIDRDFDDRGWHRCTDSMDRRVMCDCAKTVHSSILRVSRLIHQEATPVLYSSVEVRLHALLPGDDTRTSYYATKLWELLPSNSCHIASISSLVLATSTSCVPVRTSSSEDYHDELKPLWAELSLRLYSLKDFRLFILLDENYDEVDETFDYNELLGMLTLPRLQKLTLEVFVPYVLYHSDDERDSAKTHAQGLDFLHKLKQKARDKINELGKSVQVIGLVRQDGYTIHDGRKDGSYDDSVAPGEDVINAEGGVIGGDAATGGYGLSDEVAVSDGDGE